MITAYDLPREKLINHGLLPGQLVTYMNRDGNRVSQLPKKIRISTAHVKPRVSEEQWWETLVFNQRFVPSKFGPPGDTVQHVVDSYHTPGDFSDRYKDEAYLTHMAIMKDYMRNGFFVRKILSQDVMMDRLLTGIPSLEFTELEQSRLDFLIYRLEAETSG